MFLDQLSVLVAIGFSGASLGITFLTMWAIGRSEKHLLIWSIGLATIIAESSWSITAPGLSWHRSCS